MSTYGKVILAGGSGFLGTALARELVRHNADVVVLTRTPARPRHFSDAVRMVEWDGKTLGPWVRELDGARAVVNFTGRNVNCRYHAANRRAILNSRVDSVRVIDQAIARCQSPPAVVIQAATLAIVGDAGDAVLDESAQPGVGFSPDVAKAWEAAFNEADTPGTRRVLMRVSFALGKDGGALGTLARLTKCFLGGTVGSGRQYVSWIHVDDLCRAILWTIEHDHVRGLYNVTSPNPVTNRQFMRELRHALHRPWSPPAPAWAVRVGAFLMRTESELALWGRKGVPRRLLEEGFTFRFSSLPDALNDLYRGRSHVRTPLPSPGAQGEAEHS
jgi:uncharacterized protein (TIGR01777 family)